MPILNNILLILIIYIQNISYTYIQPQCICNISDPFYTFNNKMFVLHSKIDQKLIKPIIKTYEKLPKTIKESINTFSTNNEFILFKGMNALLQRDIKGFMIETRKFILNTTLGIGGLVNIAKKFKKKSTKNHDTDQYTLSHTLEKYKFKHKYYLFLPGIGPASLITFIDFMLTGKINNHYLKNINNIYNINYIVQKYKLLENIQKTAKMMQIKEYSLYKSGFYHITQSNCMQCKTVH